MKSGKVKGRIWLIADEKGRRIDNIDTDMIFHNRFLYITDQREMGKHALSNLPGWEDFPEKARPGDIIVVGRNFGSGSSRQQAVDCFISLGISAIVGESFGAIYKRNVINSGLPLIESRNIFESGLKSGDIVEIDLETGEIFSNGKLITKGRPMSKVAMDIYNHGDLMGLAQEISQ